MSPVPATAFSRQHGCTEAEWLGWLPGAVRAAEWALTAPGRAQVALPSGRLHLAWQVLAPLRIALVSMPRMQVDYRFDDAVPDAERAAFMRYFDLYMQRGGG